MNLDQIKLERYKLELCDLGLCWCKSNIVVNLQAVTRPSQCKSIDIIREFLLIQTNEKEESENDLMQIYKHWSTVHSNLCKTSKCKYDTKKANSRIQGRVYTCKSGKARDALKEKVDDIVDEIKCGQLNITMSMEPILIHNSRCSILLYHPDLPEKDRFEERSFTFMDHDDISKVNPVSISKVRKCQCVDNCRTNACPNFRYRIECSSSHHDCNNQQIQKGEFISVSLGRTRRSGICLYSETAIDKGHVILPYCGIVRTTVDYNRRYPRDRRIYGLEFGNKIWTLDNEDCGSLTRFSNMSHGPNAKVQEWTVNGVQRFAMLARHDIPAGTEICWHYGKNYNKTAACHCGATGCPKVLGGDIVDRTESDEELEDDGIPKEGEEFTEDDECFWWQ